MESVEQVLGAVGGVATVTRLHELGVSRARAARAARSGRIHRIREGVYALPSASPNVVRAARSGGRLAGASAAGELGLWMPPHQPLAVEVVRGRGRLRHPDDAAKPLTPSAEVRVIWTRDPPRPDSVGVVPVERCLAQCLRTLQPSWAVAVIDSALRRLPLTEFDLAVLDARTPTHLREVLALVDARSESGTESILRVHLALAGVIARPQVPIPFSPLERLDLLVGDRLVIECESRQYHASEQQRQRDLRRDARLVGLGFIVLHYDYAQIVFDVESVVAGILAYVDHGLHLSPQTRDSRRTS